jgi:hypothetical protein
MMTLESRSGSPDPRTAVVSDPDQARLLLDARTRAQLAPFLARPLAVGEAARAAGEKPNTVLRRVQRFLAAGLLEVAETVPRRGRPLRRYRTIADVFFVPFEASAAEDLEAALAEREAWVAAVLRRAVVRARREAIGVWGTRIYRDDRGRVQVQMAVRPDADAAPPGPEGPAVLSAWRDALELDYPDAKALQRELFELLERYQAKRGAQRYVIHLGLAPVAPEDLR